jgi:hypothetical protein
MACAVAEVNNVNNRLAIVIPIKNCIISSAIVRLRQSQRHSIFANALQY